MKIIQIIPMFGLAGAETMCENLTNGLIALGQDVRVVSLYDYHSAITDRLENNGLKIYYVHKKRGIDPSIVIKLAKLFRKEKPDVVHSHLYALKYAVFASVLSGIKVRVHTVHNVATKEMTPKDQKLNYFFYHHMKVVPVSLSQEIQETVIERYKLPKKQTPIIYNAIDLNKCIVKKNYSCKDRLKFVHIGRFSKQKNHDLLLRAFRQVKDAIPNADLSLLGKGELESEVKKLADELELSDSVHFLGVSSNVYPTLNQADVFVLSSEYEGMPMTIIEAMGTGLPIVSTNVGGISSMVEKDEEGLLTKCDPESLASAMIKMNDRELREKCGHNSRKKAEKYFSQDQMARQYLKLYKSLDR